MFLLIELDKCRINNFKSLDKFELNFSQFTCLIGLNSAGKSTILQAIDFISQQMKGDISSWLKDRGWEAKELKCKFVNSQLISVSLLFYYQGKLYGWGFAFNPIYQKCTFEDIVYIDLHDLRKNKIIFEVKNSKYMIMKDLDTKEKLQGDIIQGNYEGMWEEKVASIENGFKMEKFTRGVAMVPKPKSEAWLICALKDKPYENCEELEERSGNDKSPNNLKDELDSFNISNDKINEMIQNGQIEIDKIDMPSFQYFSTKLKELL